MLGIYQRIIVSRAVRYRAQVGDLRQVQFVGRLVKIPLRSGRDTVISVHEIDVVEIELKYLILIVFFLHVPGNEDLLDLPLPGPAVI